jgi:choline dehydrogenase-like flavoprotein
VHVEEVPVEVRSRSTELFLDGADKLGIPMYPLRRNTHGCQGKARCTFGCPHGAKMSVDHAWLPAVVAGGGRIYADCHVERVGLESGRARSVHGYVSTGPDGLEKRPFAVRAKVVVVACGTVHTPMLLSASGLEGQSRQLGRHITLHPAVRVSALFDEEVRGWDGALQSVYTDHFMDDGITLVGVYSAVNVLAAAFPGVGKEHLDHVRKMRGAAIFGGMIHDEGGGSVHRQPGREPLLTYRMVPEDKRRMLRTIGILAEMAFAGGAREVMLPVFGAPAMKSFAEVRALIDRNPEGRRIESTAFHPLGSARMAVNEKLGVVRHTGESWDVPGLYVCDGSVLPTSIGVNSQVPVMAVARKITTGLLDDWSRHARA